MDTIEFSNNVKLDNLLTSNPAMEKKVRALLAKVIKEAQAAVMQSAKQYSSKDAYQAVRKAVYKKVLGGNINILQSRRAAGKRAPVPPVVHKLETETNSKGNHRGGNRMPRSRRTEDLLSYAGADRGFILRFINSGTAPRNNGTRPTGNISARNWFSGLAQMQLERAAEKFDSLLDDLIQKQLSE